MGKSDKKNNSNKRRIILLIVAGLVLVGILAGVFFMYALPRMKSSSTDTSPTTGTTYRTELHKQQTKINTLVTTGDATSIDQANKIVDDEINAADKSGNDSYIIDAKLTKVTLYVDTNRAQEAIDTILIPLDTKYGSNPTYKYTIYGYFSLAYRALGNQDKATEYFKQIPSKALE